MNEKEFKELEQKAKKGDMEAQCNEVMHRYGEGFIQDDEEHIDKRENLVQEEQTQIDEEKRVRDILQAARERNPKAVYDTDIGELLNKGNAEAQIIMGDRWYNRNKPNPAVGWYKLAAEQGHARAQYNLGAMYQNGEGVEEDYEEAVKWLTKAAEQGLREAASRIDKIQKYKLINEAKIFLKEHKKAACQDNKYIKEVINIIDGEIIRVTVDVYDIIDSFGVTCPALQHAIKKILFAGERGHKDKNQDLNEALQSIYRAIQLETVRNTRDD